MSNSKIELKSGSDFIIQSKAGFEKVMKIRVIEVTAATVYYKILDSPNEVCIRELLDKVYRDNRVIENLGVESTGWHDVQGLRKQ